MYVYLPRGSVLEDVVSTNDSVKVKQVMVALVFHRCVTPLRYNHLPGTIEQQEWVRTIRIASIGRWMPTI